MAPAELLSPTAGIAVANATARLRIAGSPTPRLDAELLVSHALGRERAWLHAHPDALLAADQAEAVGDFVTRRAAGEPVAYIRGFKEWLSLRIATDPRALIPRPETEQIAEAAITEVAARLVADGATITAWDVGTGSGALALALALRFRTAAALGRVRLVASDLSPDALELGAENLGAHGAAGGVSLACGDLLEAADLSPSQLDVIVANLPYVPSAQVAQRAGSLAFEPQQALDGGHDGLDVIRRLLAQLPSRLAPHGVALLEIGAGQAETVRALVEELPMRSVVSAFPDLAGIERVVRIARL